MLNLFGVILSACAEFLYLIMVKENSTKKWLEDNEPDKIGIEKEAG